MASTNFKDLWDYLKVRKKYWLLPIVLVLLVLAALVALSSGTAVSPFVYTFF